jgi:hypothetical protein
LIYIKLEKWRRFNRDTSDLLTKVQNPAPVTGPKAEVVITCTFGARLQSGEGTCSLQNENVVATWERSLSRPLNSADGAMPSPLSP